MLIIKKSLFTAFFIVIAATGVAVGLKAAVGVGAWDAFSQATSTVIGIKVGTFSMMMNLSCIIVQLVILKKDFQPLAFLQIFMAVLLGFFVNLVYYDVLASLTINSYIINLMIYVGSLLIIIAAVALIMSIDFLSFPLEAACVAIASKTRFSFGTIRQWVDIVSIIGAVTIALLFRNPIPVREGTVIGMLMFGPLIARFIPVFRPMVKKWGFAE